MHSRACVCWDRVRACVCMWGQGALAHASAGEDRACEGDQGALARVCLPGMTGCVRACVWGQGAHECIRAGVRASAGAAGSFCFLG